MVFQQQEIDRIKILLEQVVNKSFSEVKSVIEKRINELLELYGITLEEESKKILVIGYYRAVQEYSTAKPRKLGGPYFLHPEQTIGVLLGAGVKDPITLLVGLFHDAIEEKKKYSSRRNAREEKKYIKKQGEQLQQRLVRNLIGNGIKKEYAYTITRQVKESVVLLTRRTCNEIYYEYIHRLFNSRSKFLSESRRRAIIVKCADRYANTLDLERQDYTEFPARISLQEIIDAYSQQNSARIKELNQMYEESARDHPLERLEWKFGGDKKLHPCFKNIFVINREREWRQDGNPAIHEADAIPLTRATKEVTDRIINHLCTYHCSPDRVYQLYLEHERYVASGGYGKVTKESSSEGYDGIVQKFFDARIHGNPDALASLFTHRELMLRAAIGFNHICAMYLKDPEYILHGFTRKGVHAVAPVMKK
ncbi:MAG: hypothetical protein WC254_05735 [Candidatus Woesearchaeota archaeon]|jgi:hypothetical protein